MPNKASIVIQVRGGVVSAVHGDIALDVFLVDWDNIEDGDKAQLIDTERLDCLDQEAKAQVRLCAANKGLMI